MARQKRDITEKYHSKFATRLRQLIEKHSITQDSIASCIGVSRQTVSQYVNGISDPSFETLGKIADYFNVTTDYLLGRTDDPSPHPSAVDELGLSPGAIIQLRRVADNHDALVWLNKFIGSRLFPLLPYIIRQYARAIEDEIKYLQNKLLEHNGLIPEDVHEDKQNKELALELEQLHPHLKGRVLVSTGDSIIDKQYEQCISTFTSILKKITSSNELESMKTDILLKNSQRTLKKMDAHIEWLNSLNQEDRIRVGKELNDRLLFGKILP